MEEQDSHKGDWFAEGTWKISATWKFSFIYTSILSTSFVPVTTLSAEDTHDG